MQLLQLSAQSLHYLLTYWMSERRKSHSGSGKFQTVYKSPRECLCCHRAFKMNSVNQGEITNRRVGHVAEEMRRNLRFSPCFSVAAPVHDTQDRNGWMCQKPFGLLSHIERFSERGGEANRWTVVGRACCQSQTDQSSQDQSPKLSAFTTLKRSIEAKVNNGGWHKMSWSQKIEVLSYLWSYPFSSILWNVGFTLGWRQVSFWQPRNLFQPVLRADTARASEYQLCLT